MRTQIPGWRKKVLLFLTSQCITLFGSTLVQMAIVQFAVPAAAGAIFAVSSLPATLLVDILTAAVGIGLFSCVLLPKQHVSKKKASVFADMKTGVRYAFGHRLIGRHLLLYGSFALLCVPAGFLAELLVRRVYGDTYWYLTSVELVGLAGMMGVSRNFILYLALMLFYGVALTVVQTAATTLLQEKTEISMQGRMFGLPGSMYAGFLPVGMAVLCHSKNKPPAVQVEESSLDKSNSCAKACLKIRMF